MFLKIFSSSFYLVHVFVQVAHASYQQFPGYFSNFQLVSFVTTNLNSIQSQTIFIAALRFLRRLYLHIHHLDVLLLGL